MTIMANDRTTWAMIHGERAAVSDQLATLTPQQWAAPSLCTGWNVHTLAAHILAGAEQTPGAFFRRFAGSGFRFNAMIDHDARRLSALAPTEIVDRLRARTATTNHPPAPVTAMLGEVVVHGADMRASVGLPGSASPEASVACLDMYTTASFPVGGKKRIAGLRLSATDTGWTYGDGPIVSGPSTSLLLAMTGRAAGLEGLSGDGVPTLRERLVR
jgi:uncharacterized protein (TIGR03083 family)